MLVCKQFNWPAPGGLQGPDKALCHHLPPGVQDVKDPPAGPALSVFPSFSALMALPPPSVLPACLRVQSSSPPNLPSNKSPLQQIRMWWHESFL